MKRLVFITCALLHCALTFAFQPMMNGNPQVQGSIRTAKSPLTTAKSPVSGWTYVKAVVTKLDDAVWGKRGMSQQVVLPPETQIDNPMPLPHLADAEVLKRRAYRHEVLLKRKQCLALECKLNNILRIAGEKPSKTETAEIERISSELENMQSQEAAAAAAAAAAGFNRSLLATPVSELGTWRTIHAPKGSVLQKVMRREADTREVQRVTYISQYMRIARGENNSLFVFQRLSGPSPECEDCAALPTEQISEAGKWFWPL